jgi:hypothetical protein
MNHGRQENGADTGESATQSIDSFLVSKKRRQNAANTSGVDHGALDSLPERSIAAAVRCTLLQPLPLQAQEDQTKHSATATEKHTAASFSMDRLPREPSMTCATPRNGSSFSSPQKAAPEL